MWRLNSFVLEASWSNLREPSKTGTAALLNAVRIQESNGLTKASPAGLAFLIRGS
jgi:hypothetical protein